MDERVQAMREIWTQDEAEFHGRHVDLDPMWSCPKPAQRPPPPILVGGTGKGVIRRVLAYGDEWMPHAGMPIEQLSRESGSSKTPPGPQDAKPTYPSPSKAPNPTTAHWKRYATSASP